MDSSPPFVAPLEHDAGDFLLRAYRPGDGEALREATLASYEHLRPWMPWARTEYPLDEAEAQVRRMAARYFANEDFTLGIWQDGSLRGGTGFHLRGGPVESRQAEIGMWIRADAAGQGLGTKVLKAMLQWGFDAWPWDRLEWRCDPRNLASAQVARKNGLMLEGTLRQNVLDPAGQRRDSHVFAILRTDWEAQG